MKDYTSNTPIFSEAIKITESSDPAYADIINEAPIQIFENTLCNRESIEQLKRNAVPTGEYNPEAFYQSGDYCMYQDILYKCVQETTGEMDRDCWQPTNAMDEIRNFIGLLEASGLFGKDGANTLGNAAFVETGTYEDIDKILAGTYEYQMPPENTGTDTPPEDTGTDTPPEDIGTDTQATDQEGV